MRKPRERKYKIGEFCGERIIVGYKERYITVKCSLCGRETSAVFAQLKDKVCICKQPKIHQRYSGRTEEHSQAELKELKEKYKNGVPDEVIEKWIMNL